jgi:chemotaxis protein CheD
MVEMEQYKTHFLFPSALFASKIPHLVTTVLGSCVAVCIWDKKLKIGGINHYMMPYWNGKELASPKYGNIAIEKLVSRMYTLGSDKKDLVAKVFGGGEVIQSDIAQFHIGVRNIQVAKVTLKELGLPIVAESTGGKLGRKIIYHTQTGQVRMKYIKKVNYDNLNFNAK